MTWVKFLRNEHRYEAEIGSDLSRCNRVYTFGYCTFRIIQVAKQDCVVTRLGTSLGAGGSVTFIDSMYAHGATFHGALAAWNFRFLVGQYFMYKRSCLVRAGHHAVAASDADMLVNKHDAICSLERSLRGAYIYTGWLFAVLAHHR